MENELYYFHASGGTDRVLTSSCLISRTEKLMGFLLSIYDDDLFYSTRRPDNQCYGDEVVDIIFFTKKSNCPIGCGQNMAKLVMENKGVHAFIRNLKKTVRCMLTICLFRCLALHRENKLTT